ncbi:unnamed protein product [Calicophoron daubneyi]|uniref:Uncharacterized protein n=1 Tax=Calicophoron daubneyi TaxID=300641 RepID=A0AAV2SZY4_CALDB
MLVRDRNNESSRLFEFLCPAPSKFSLPDQNRPESLVAVPGVVKGLHEAHKLFGKLQWSALFEGALKAAKDGFKPDTALLNSVNVVKQANRSVPQPLVDGLLTWERLGRYQPPVELEKTLQSLSSTGSEYFYSQANNSFGSRLLSFLSSSGQGWGEAADIQNYTVNQPTPIKVGFAGFTLESFPAPLVGGAYLLQLLGNLDLKDTLAPLNYGALWENNPRETGTLLHRFIELSKLSAVAVGSLGDTSDPKIRDSAISAQNSLFDPDARKRTVNLVSDSATLPINASVPSFLNLSLGDTSIVVTDSSRFTVVISLYLGSLFGNGQIVPGTGVHLNSGLSPFLGPLPPGSTTGTLNLISSGRRPLVPIAPLYLSTTGRKCGIRTGIASSGGLWGVQDAAQTVINAALFLHAATCTLPSGSKPPLALVETDGARSRGASADKGNELNRSSYNPASTRGCINLQAATGFPRLHSDLKNISYAIYTEQTYNQTLLSRLQELGHIIHFWPSDWPGRVSAAGWNGYELMTSYDKRGSWSSAVY